MTWNEFKLAVDKELEEKQISSDIDIEYIDVFLPDYIRAFENKLGIGISDG